MMREEGYDQCQVLSEDQSTSEDKWSSISTFVLWMIKDKLDSLDDRRVSVAVCRDWCIASAYYIRDISLGNCPPRLLQTSKKRISNTYDFISVANGKKDTLQLPELRDYYILYSKEGWFLLHQKDSNSCTEVKVILMNPFKKSMIKLPSFVSSKRFEDRLGSFSIREGYPHCVVLLLVGCYQDYPFTIKTAYPRANISRWTNQHFKINIHEFNQLININEYVYCYNRDKKLIVYNVDTKVWKEATESSTEIGGHTHCYLTEFEGQVVEIQQKNEPWEFSFLRYDVVKDEWEELDKCDLKDTSWYVADCWHYMGRFSFCKKQEGVKVYHVCKDDNSPSSSSSFHVVCYDLIARNKEIVSLPCGISSAALWVDI